MTAAIASGVFAAVVFAVTVLTVLVAMFILAWAIASVWYSSDGSELVIESELPPQIIPPRDPIL